MIVSITVLVVIIVGGMASLPGVLLASFVLVGLPELPREFEEYRLVDWSPSWWRSCSPRRRRRATPARPVHRGLPLSRSLDAALLTKTVGMRFGGIWAVRVLLLFLVAFLRAWSQREDAWTRTSAWVGGWGVGGCAGGHPGAQRACRCGARCRRRRCRRRRALLGGRGVVRRPVPAGTCVLPRADVGMLAAVPRLSSVVFTAMVVIVGTGILRGWRQLGSVQALA